ncbi:hypothetical protein TNCV_80241 [Trichonephila clavipes]|nr:hypothetical protein TNCV_80241 [Trichonephila clavipes]
MEHLRFLLEEVETSEKELDQAREEIDEILDSNDDNESKFEKNYEHETFESKGRFCKCSLRNFVKKDTKPQVYHKTNSVRSKRHKQEKI